MENSFWKQEIRQKLSESSRIVSQCYKYKIKIYLFGSARLKRFPHDLDIVIKYPYSSMADARTVRDETMSILKKAFLLPVDVVLISYEEDQQARFLSQEHAELIFP